MEDRQTERKNKRGNERKTQGTEGKTNEGNKITRGKHMMQC
jgi:hypothetical protein